jgi:hypothetical protein
MALCHDMQSYSELAQLGTLAGRLGSTSGYSPTSFLLNLAEAFRPLASRKLSEWQKWKDQNEKVASKGEIEPWDHDWVEYRIICSQVELSDKDPSPSLKLPNLCLKEVIAGLNLYLSAVMGIEVTPHMCSGGTDVLQHLLESLATASKNDNAAAAAADDDDDDDDDDGQMPSAPSLVYSVEVEGRGLVGHLVINPQGGFGTRYFARGVVRHPYSSHNMSCLESASSGEGSLPTVLVGLNWSSSSALPRAAKSLLELVHELGHALHFLLSTRCHGSNKRTTTPFTPCPLPGYRADDLPLELLEVPSTIFELLLTNPYVIAYMLPEGE